MTNTQDFLVQHIVSEIIEYIIEERKVDMATATKIWAGNDLAEKLCDEETGLYLEGASYVYELFKAQDKSPHQPAKTAVTQGRTP